MSVDHPRRKTAHVTSGVQVKTRRGVASPAWIAYSAEARKSIASSAYETTSTLGGEKHFPPARSTRLDDTEPASGNAQQSVVASSSTAAALCSGTESQAKI